MKAPASAQKVRGGYYTPPIFAEFLADWAVRDASSRVLEPSCGDGEILAAVARELRRKGAAPENLDEQIVAVEVDATEASKARHRVRSENVGVDGSCVKQSDFFAYCVRNGEAQTFDAVVGNPPFIRFQHFAEEHRTIALELMKREGLKPNRLTNSWVPFVVAATRMLQVGGHLALVLPAELLQVDYASQLRLYLTNKYRRITVFTFRRLVFEGILQEVVLLCAERGFAETPRIEIVELEDANELVAYEHVEFEKRARKRLDHSTDKWTRYFLSQTEIDLLRDLESNAALTRLGELASVDVGVVTGLNDFFVLSEEQRKSADLNGQVRPIVARSAQLTGLRFRAEDWVNSSDKGGPVHLLNLPSVPIVDLPKGARDYVEAGQTAGAHTGYKCRIRKLWYIVPSVWNPDAFLLRQIHRYPKLVVNDAGATCTDTIHRVKLKDGVDPTRLAGAFINSVTFALSEVVGRSYGGGVLELEPREAERLLVPYDAAKALDVSALDSLIADGRVEEALDLTDRVVLQDCLGFSESDVKRLRHIWQKLQGRRLGRGKRRATAPAKA